MDFTTNQFIWAVLMAISAVLLYVYLGGERDAVWGGFAYGAIIGVIGALFLVVTGENWSGGLAVKCAVAGVLIGFGIEVVKKARKARLEGKE